jgi:hypothetical protein
MVVRMAVRGGVGWCVYGTADELGDDELPEFYQTWIVEVVMIPLTLLLFLCGWYLYRAKNEGATVALNKFFSEAFFLLYALRAILV